MSKTILITGASSGIGKSLALEFAKRGYSLGLTARRTDRLEAIREEILSKHSGIQVEVQSLDVMDTAAVEPAFQSLLSRLGEIDVVMVNAGINQLTGVGRGQLKEELDMIQTNLLGAIATVHSAVQYFKTRKKGHVVGVSSLAGLMPIPKQAAYCSTKAGFTMYLDCAAIELKKYNINVTKILPGFVKTEIVENMEQYPFLVSSEQAAKEIADHVEKKRDTGVVPGYPWKFVKPFMSNMPKVLWRYIKV